jgi:hypothetical protein
MAAKLPIFLRPTTLIAEVILGITLLIAAYFVGNTILFNIGVILIVIGAIPAILGVTRRASGAEHEGN